MGAALTVGLLLSGLMFAAIFTVVMTPALYVVMNFMVGNRGDGPFLRCLACSAGMAGISFIALFIIIFLLLLSFKLAILAIIGYLTVCCILIESMFELPEGRGKLAMFFVSLVIIGMGYVGFQSSGMSDRLSVESSGFGRRKGARLVIDDSVTDPSAFEEEIYADDEGDAESADGSGGGSTSSENADPYGTASNSSTANDYGVSEGSANAGSTQAITPATPTAPAFNPPPAAEGGGALLEGFRGEVMQGVIAQLGSRYNVSFGLPASAGPLGNGMFMVIKRYDGSAMIYFNVDRQQQLGMTAQQVIGYAVQAIDTASPQTFSAMQGFDAITRTRDDGGFDFGMHLASVYPGVQNFYNAYGAINIAVPPDCTQVLNSASAAPVAPARRAWDLVLTPEELAPLQVTATSAGANTSYANAAEAPTVPGLETAAVPAALTAPPLNGDSEATRSYDTPLGPVQVKIWVFNSSQAALSHLEFEKFQLPKVTERGYFALVPEPSLALDRFISLCSATQPDGQTQNSFCLQRWVGNVEFAVTVPYHATPAERQQLLALADAQEAKVRKLLAGG
jgi:hypothetical protein